MNGERIDLTDAPEIGVYRQGYEDGLWAFYDKLYMAKIYDRTIAYMFSTVRKLLEEINGN